MTVTLTRFIILAIGVIMLAGLNVSAARADTFEYDALGRVIRIEYDNGRIVEYNYDATGNRTSSVISGDASPVAVDDFYTQNVNQVKFLRVLDNDTDPGGLTLRLQSFTTPTPPGATATKSGNRVRFVATSAGVYTFQYTVRNTLFLTDTATVTVTVN